jgi:transaldolase
MEAKTAALEITPRATGMTLMQRFAETNPELEVWWDSSPLVFETWRSEMIEGAAPEDRARIEEELRVLWDPQDLTSTVFRGGTTNPPLSLAAMRNDPERWADWIADYQAEHLDAKVDDVFWALYLHLVKLGAEMLRPLFDKSGQLRGHLSGQVDPRKAFDGEAMLRQGLEIAAQGPNVMVKIPGTTEGLPVLRELTARGIPTNCTSAYILPQFIAVAENVQAGLLEARQNGVDLTRWKSVVTDMSARWEDSRAFVESARSVGVELSDNDRRWAGIAVFKESQRVFRARAYPSKMLICSVRVGPEVDGVQRCWHLEHTAGANAVFTLPPAFLGSFITQCDHLEFGPRIWNGIPSDVKARLHKVPYFNAGHDVDGTAVEDFSQIPALQATYQEFSKATEDMVEFVRERMS